MSSIFPVSKFTSILVALLTTCGVFANDRPVIGVFEFENLSPDELQVEQIGQLVKHIEESLSNSGVVDVIDLQRIKEYYKDAGRAADFEEYYDTSRAIEYGRLLPITHALSGSAYVQKTGEIVIMPAIIDIETGKQSARTSNAFSPDEDFESIHNKSMDMVREMLSTMDLISIPDETPPVNKPPRFIDFPGGRDMTAGRKLQVSIKVSDEDNDVLSILLTPLDGAKLTRLTNGIAIITYTPPKYLADTTIIIEVHVADGKTVISKTFPVRIEPRQTIRDKSYSFGLAIGKGESHICISDGCSRARPTPFSVGMFYRKYLTTNIAFETDALYSGRGAEGFLVYTETGLPTGEAYELHTDYIDIHLLGMVAGKPDASVRLRVFAGIYIGIDTKSDYIIIDTATWERTTIDLDPNIDLGYTFGFGLEYGGFKASGYLLGIEARLSEGCETIIRDHPLESSHRIGWLKHRKHEWYTISAYFGF